MLYAAPDRGITFFGHRPLSCLSCFLLRVLLLLHCCTSFSTYLTYPQWTQFHIAQQISSFISNRKNPASSTDRHISVSLCVQSNWIAFHTTSPWMVIIHSLFPTAFTMRLVSSCTHITNTSLRDTFQSRSINTSDWRSVAATKWLSLLGD